MRKIAIMFIWALMSACSKKSTSDNEVLKVTEKYRPEYHFTPKSGWMNDPNGLTFFEGEYHLFYQYYPDSTVWGPMHLGHAVSKDLNHWEELPIALYPDSLGYIFSGSAVIDYNNTSGFGTKDKPAMVAIFTYHNMEGEKANKIDFQTQGIAYSLDKGRTWTKYEGNPVLKNPGIKDFRDPKVSWYAAENKWVMVLAVKSQANIYSSKDLKNWTLESEFGKTIGSHEGVWECPDLFPLKDQNGLEKWVMLVSINPNGPQGGSATQYFVGDFDGKTFTRADTITRWMDYGADNYAGVTFSNIPEKDGRRILIGWMSNWQYANVVPTEKWRSATTIPRELSIEKTPTNGYRLNSTPIKETIDSFDKGKTQTENSFESEKGNYLLELSGIVDAAGTLEFSNEKGERFSVKFDKSQLITDRTMAGESSFSKEFAAIHKAPLNGIKVNKIQVFIDASSAEIFINDGELVMTELIFPNEPLTKIKFMGNTQEKKIFYLK